MVAVGSFLPWVDTAFGTVAGSRGAGLWTFYAAMLGLAGALVSRRTLAGAQAAVLGAAAVILPAWQASHLILLVGFQGWAPGPGLVLTFGGGVLALTAARSLFRSADDPQA